MLPTELRTKELKHYYLKQMFQAFNYPYFQTNCKSYLTKLSVKLNEYQLCFKGDSFVSCVSKIVKLVLSFISWGISRDKLF